MIVHFEKVGCYNLSFERECKGELTYDFLERQVRKYCMSNDLNFIYNRETGIGYIYCGIRVIGKYWFESKKDRSFEHGEIKK